MEIPKQPNVGNLLFQITTKSTGSVMICKNNNLLWSEVCPTQIFPGMPNVTIAGLKVIMSMVKRMQLESRTTY